MKAESQSRKVQPRGLRLAPSIWNFFGELKFSHNTPIRTLRLPQPSTVRAGTMPSMMGNETSLLTRARSPSPSPERNARARSSQTLFEKAKADNKQNRPFRLAGHSTVKRSVMPQTKMAGSQPTAVRRARAPSPSRLAPSFIDAIRRSEAGETVVQASCHLASLGAR